MKTRKIHKWTKNDTIIMLFFCRYGLTDLPIRNESELAETVINAPLISFRTHCATIKRYLDGEECDITKLSKLQLATISKYRDMSFNELRELASDIIRVKLQKIRERRLRIESKPELDREAQNRKQLEAIFKRMGKDPKKMRKIER